MKKDLRLLSHFDSKYKGVAFNEILFCIRNGKRYADEIIFEIQDRLEKQKRWGLLRGTNAQWDFYFKLVKWNEQIEDFEEAIKDAKDWESKSREEKQKIKDEQAEFFKKQSMKGKPATESQITFLKSKGLDDLEIPSDRFECSEIIDKLIKEV